MIFDIFFYILYVWCKMMKCFLIRYYVCDYCKRNIIIFCMSDVFLLFVIVFLLWMNKESICILLFKYYNKLLLICIIIYIYMYSIFSFFIDELMEMGK